MLIDTHCHLNFHAFEKDLDDVVRRAEEAGVEKIIIPGTDPSSSKKAIEIAQTYESCYGAVGIHPHHTKDANLVINDDMRHQLKELLTQPKVLAAGEIGLDYHVYKNSKYESNDITDEYKDKQKQLLTLQLELALELNKPVIFHCRDAHDDMIQTISTFSRKGSPAANSVKPARGVFHCFGGSTQQLELILTMGYYIGFDGNITYSRNWKKIVAATPLERIVLETDAPFLTPVPHRGTRNEPSYLPLVAQAVADAHGKSVSEVIHLSTQNAISLFGFPATDTV